MTTFYPLQYSGKPRGDLVDLQVKPNPVVTGIPLPVVGELTWTKRLRAHYQDHRLSYLIATLLAAFTGVMTGWNIAGYPIWFTDEGTYMSQSWAVLYEGKLANYTYWYDHPPVGWLQLSVYSAISGALHRQTGQTIMAGREFMVICRVATVILMYALLRRLGVRRMFSFIACVVFVLSPLALEYDRYVLLDNMVLPWLLASFLFALNSQRRIVTSVAAGFCAGMAFLTKETFLVVIPVVMVLFWVHTRKAENRWSTRCFFYFTLIAMGLVYVVYAVIKNELIPGPGHVSLWGSLDWQLFQRQKNGSVLDPLSDAHALARSWYVKDPWFTTAGIVAMIPLLLSRRLWPVAFALALQVAMMMRNGYLPYPYIIGLLPFMAMLIGGLADMCWPSWQTIRHGRWYQQTLGVISAVLVLTTAAGALVYVSPVWHEGDRYALNADTTAYQRDAVSWVDQNVPKNTRLITEGAYWLDFRTQGFNRVVWREKLDTDPEVMTDLGGANNIEYMVLAPESISHKNQQMFPTFGAAVRGSEVIASFGHDFDKVIIMRKREEPQPPPQVTGKR